MKKTILRTFLVCLFALTGADAFAYDFEVDGIYYDLWTSSSVRITSGDNKYSGAVEIPETVTHEGKTYTVTNIGMYAFYNCLDLTEVTISKNIRYLASSYMHNPFEGCSRLEKITVKEDNPYYDSRENCNAIIDTESNTLRVGCKNTKIPSSVTAIGANAFNGCSGLTELTVPNNITSIGDWAFKGCSGLKKAVIPNGLTSLNSTFVNCTSLEEIVIPNSVTSLNATFSGCTSLKEIVIPNNVKVLEETFRGCESLTKPTIGNGVVSIGENTFYGCNSLAELTIPNNVTSIGDYAFYECNGLTKLTIGNNVTSIGNFAFAFCTGLTELTIPNSVTSIGNLAFVFCENLAKLVIGNGVTSIGDGAFGVCSNLISVTSLSTIPPVVVSSPVSDGISEDATLYVPAGSKALYGEAEGWKDFLNILELPTTVSVDTNGLATYCPTTSLDFSGATEIAAYKATVSGNTVKLTRVETVAAGEGVLLRSLNGDAACEQLPTIDATKNADNAFVGTTEDITLSATDGNVTNFVLSASSGAVGFFKANNTQLAAGKAYLPVENYDAARSLTIVFDDNATGISEVSPVQPADDAFYTLDGVRVTAPAKGLYIKNGKKVFIK